MPTESTGAPRPNDPENSVIQTHNAGGNTCVFQGPRDGEWIRINRDAVRTAGGRA